ncbi:hypothetical protein PR001_g2263 [Phytophthora rubi]|uniref:Uncharacterized protein n=1 Tax=Phytophthora rubi TaxID=129364 RepID=A0A6A3NP29_9STRA|nr:hypothetical protein PR002_g2366 [Phytophthora rubi]KAE9050589.1 hypothetical protein PR001_g2263 [Phytophthora rubi]
MKNCGAQTNDVVKSVGSSASAKKESKEWTSQQNEIGPEKGSPVAPEFIEDKSSPKVVNSNSSRRRVGTQCRVVKDGQTQANRVRRLRGPPPLTIADKFPIWIDLDGVGSGGEKNHFKERKQFLRVARFGSLDTTDDSINNGSAEDSQLLPISSSASIVLTPRKLSSEDGSEENQSDGRLSPTLSSVQAEDDRITNEAMNAKYRASYRQHYPSRERLSRKSDDHDSANGIDTLIDLRDNMQRMTQRLRKLETCANSIDKEFKDSQKRLSQIGDGNSLQTRTLDNIDEVLEMTDELDGPPGGQRSNRGLLSKKASSDLNTAKKLLETIEQLTISASDE